MGLRKRKFDGYYQWVQVKGYGAVEGDALVVYPTERRLPK